ncbi:hypothetical protein D1007_49981 [Hordeum vulgare]|nr:hypothetical protein D1007_49981 [Hordeum vulgare]
MRSLVKDGSSSSTVIVVSPEISQTTQPAEIGESKSTTIILSPAVNTNVHVGSGSSSSSTRISPLGKRISPHMTNDGNSTPVPEHVLNVIKDLSESAKRLGMFQGKKYDSTGAISKTQAANANKRSHGSSSDKARDNRPGAFTLPSFSLGLSPILSNPSNEVNIDYEHLDVGNPLEIMPLSWAQPTVVETGLQMVEYPLSDKLTAFLATGDQDEIDADLAEELDDYERYLEDFFKKKRAAATTAGAARSNNMAGETGVQSVTPKTNPHKGRVKKPSRFKLSPYDDDINVTSEEEDIYKKLMLSSKYKRMEIHRSKSAHSKKIVTNIFERKKDFALSCQNLIMFPVIEEMGGKEVSGHHWYVLCINNTAQRFEALDSLRSKGNIGLIYHANAVMRRIKEAWKLYYHKSRVQIENYELEIIDAPK